ncbi:alpha/beta fold hydrolase [Micromonospora sp. RHAY321]|uniref:thioesterase II family protein n=1 Tax=Micromonospora sp. RHAY321 TaxID=2944807 RepID=UPI00207D6841|nr:alpha/beta fold hydrolase [Micromonospora sp. RHAY321]MCO1593979.1 alpha/beta fold hydrolase [Micromonospora sp. RHAY321]
MTAQLTGPPDPPAGVRLFCFAHAGGGGAAYRPWRDRLSPDVEVCPVVLPGRESRWQQRPHREMTSLVEQVLQEIVPRLHQPFALFGHSLGAAVAYEVCARLCDRGLPPMRLFVSGRRPPHLPARQGATRHLTDDAFVAYLNTLNGIPTEVLAHPGLLRALLPTIRADFEVNETYAASARRLPVAVSALTGDSDPLVTPAEMLAWRDVTDRGFRLRVLTGDHFYLTAAAEHVCAAIGRELSVPGPTVPIGSRAE